MASCNFDSTLLVIPVLTIYLSIMKQIKTLSILSALLAFVFVANAQHIKGNKNVVTVARNISAFTQLDISGVGDVTIKQGDREGVTITTDENIQQYIETVNEGSKLSIRTKEHSSISSSELKIEITIKDLTEMKVSGTGEVKTTSPLTLDNLTCRTSGTGNLAFDFNCKKLNLKISGAGNVTLKGKGDDVDIHMSGAGNLGAFDFTAQKLNAELSGMGNAELKADSELSIEASGMGNVTYTGNASVKKLEASATGRVKKM
jgi:hypothetical protein